MVQSMTGFGRCEVSESGFQVVVEIKSVNNRFKDIRFKLPNILNQYEIEMKNIVAAIFSRGSLDIYVNYKKTDKLGKLEDLDEEKILLYVEKMKKISKSSGIKMDFGPCDFLRAEFYNERDEEMVHVLRDLVTKALKEALVNLKNSRELEGRKLISAIKVHLTEFNKNFLLINERSKEYQEEITSRLQKKFREFSADLKIDEPRFSQEVVYYLEKLDVNEEIDRISSHLTQVDELINSNKEIGREIDFLIQELGRETNTIGSKSGHTEISDLVVQMKVQLEKIREQGLNLE